MGIKSHKLGIDYVIESFLTVSTVEKEQVIRFWSDKKFECQEVDGEIICKKGSLFTNLHTFDMEQIKRKVVINISGNKIHIKTHVCGRGQLMTELNLYFFRLEHLLFKSHLSNSSSDILEMYLKEQKLDKSRFIFSMGLKESKISSELESEMMKLAGSDLLPKILECNEVSRYDRVGYIVGFAVMIMMNLIIWTE